MLQPPTLLPIQIGLLNNGAYHVIVDLKNLSFHTSYDGKDDIVIGDGKGLTISLTDSVSLFAPSQPFSLSNVRRVPTMKRNLISISQFCHSNNTSIDFLPTLFFVKDLRMGTILLQGQTKDGCMSGQLLLPSCLH